MALCLALPAHADDMQDAAKLLKAGQHQQAMDKVNKALATKPSDPQAQFLKGLIFTEQGKTREAIEIFTQLTKDHPELPEPYNNLAVIYASQGQYDKARVALEQSIRTHPSYATAYENLGDVYAKLASQAYNKALQIDSSNTGAQNKLSLVRELVGGPAPAPAAVAAAPAKEPAKPPVVVAQKEPEKAQKPAPAADATGEVMKAVNGWAEAWSRKDADAYLGFYAKDFDPSGKQSRADWEKTRRARIAAPKSISVEIASPKVTMQDSDTARVTFRQTYSSDVFKGTSNKTLILVRADGRWLIREERGG